jgi:hypothetical protein
MTIYHDSELRFDDKETIRDEPQRANRRRNLPNDFCMQHEQHGAAAVEIDKIAPASLY